MAKFKYKKRAVEGIVKRTTQDGGAFDKFLLSEFQEFKPTGGNSYSGRIAPPTFTNIDGSEPDHFGLDIWLNYNIGADGGTYLSRSKMGKEGDAVVDLATKLRVLGEKYKKQIKALRPKKRVLVWWLPRGLEREGWKLWAMPWTFDKDLAKRAYSKSTGEVLLVDDPFEGYDISFDVEGTGLNTKYTAIDIARRSSPIVRDEDELEKLTDFLTANPLQDTLKFFDNEYLANMLDAMDVDTLGDEREEDTVEDTKEGKDVANDSEPVPDIRDQRKSESNGREKIDDDGTDLDASLSDAMGDGF